MIFQTRELQVHSLVRSNSTLMDLLLLIVVKMAPWLAWPSGGRHFVRTGSSGSVKCVNQI